MYTHICPEYLAGIVDGEGSVFMSPSFYRYSYPRIVVTNTHRGLLDQIQSTFGGKMSLHTKAGRRMKDSFRYLSNKPCWRWNTAGSNAVRILLTILSFLIVKKQRTEDVLSEYFSKRLSLLNS